MQKIIFDIIYIIDMQIKVYEGKDLEDLGHVFQNEKKYVFYEGNNFLIWNRIF